MEKTYKHLGFFFIALLLVVTWGFYRTYLIQFPNFKVFTTVHHLHGFVLLSWMIMLIVQPFLIRYGKVELHRKVGKLSYVLMPLVMISIFAVSRNQYYTMLPAAPLPAVIAALALNLPPIFAFGSMYTLAMIYKKNTAYHMRFMIGTSLLVIGPGLGRALITYFGVPFEEAIDIILFVEGGIAALLLISDLIKRKAYQPYTIVLSIIVAMHICWQFRTSGWWQAFGKWFAGWAF